MLPEHEIAGLVEYLAALETVRDDYATYLAKRAAGTHSTPTTLLSRLMRNHGLSVDEVAEFVKGYFDFPGGRAQAIEEFIREAITTLGEPPPETPTFELAGDAPAPVLVVTTEEIDNALYRALRPADTAWAEHQKAGVDDAGLMREIARLIDGPVPEAPGQPKAVGSGTDRVRLWVSWGTPDPGSRPSLSGKKLLARARELLDLPLPRVEPETPLLPEEPPAPEVVEPVVEVLVEVPTEPVEEPKPAKGRKPRATKSKEPKEPKAPKPKKSEESWVGRRIRYAAGDSVHIGVVTADRETVIDFQDESGEPWTNVRKTLCKQLRERKGDAEPTAILPADVLAAFELKVGDAAEKFDKHFEAGTVIVEGDPESSIPGARWEVEHANGMKAVVELFNGRGDIRLFGDVTVLESDGTVLGNTVIIDRPLSGPHEVAAADGRYVLTISA